MVNSSKRNRISTGSTTSAGPRNARRKFTGELAKPILIGRHDPTPLGYGKDDAAQLAVKSFAVAIKAMMFKLDLLFAHYDLIRSRESGSGL